MLGVLWWEFVESGWFPSLGGVAEGRGGFFQRLESLFFATRRGTHPAFGTPPRRGMGRGMKGILNIERRTRNRRRRYPLLGRGGRRAGWVLPNPGFNTLNHRFHFIFNFTVPKPKKPNSERFQLPLSLVIFFFFKVMTISVHLDSELKFFTVEIDDPFRNGFLSIKPYAELFPIEPFPEKNLSQRHVGA